MNYILNGYKYIWSSYKARRIHAKLEVKAVSHRTSREKNRLAFKKRGGEESTNGGTHTQKLNKEFGLKENEGMKLQTNRRKNPKQLLQNGSKKKI